MVSTKRAAADAELLHQKAAAEAAAECMFLHSVSAFAAKQKADARNPFSQPEPRPPQPPPPQLLQLPLEQPRGSSQALPPQREHKHELDQPTALPSPLQRQHSEPVEAPEPPSTPTRSSAENGVPLKFRDDDGGDEIDSTTECDEIDAEVAPPRPPAIARKSPTLVGFASPVVTATAKYLVSPAKLGTRPTPKIGGSKKRKILARIQSSWQPVKDLRWSIQSTTPSCADAQQPYREAALFEAELAALAEADTVTLQCPV